MSRRLFTAKGYEETTMEDIAEAAEVSKATLYNYFSSKENLLLGIAEAALDEVRQLISEDLRDEPDSLEKLRRVMETLVTDSIRYLTLFRRILYSNLSPDSELHVTRQELVEILGQMVREAQDQGRLRRDLSPEALTEGFLGAYLLTQFGWENLEHYTPEQCHRRVQDMIDQLLAGVAEKREA